MTQTTVTIEQIVHSLREIPVERWPEVLRYLDSLKNPAPPIRTGSDLLQVGLIGLWADRDDLGDSREFARRLRQQLSLDELLERVTDDNLHGEGDSGPAVGREVW